MKTDDRTTRPGDSSEDDEAKVVRLSDWLAPDDELVPFGPRADARAAAREAVDAQATADPDLPPASGFWDGDTSVHTAVPGPEIFDEPDEHRPKRIPGRRPELTWRPAPDWRSLLHWRPRAREAGSHLAERLSWRWVAAGLALVVAVAAILVIAVAASSPGRPSQLAEAGLGDQPQHIGSTALSTPRARHQHLRLTRRASRASATDGTAARRAGATEARPSRPHHPAAAQLPNTSSSTVAPAQTTTTQYTPTPTTPAPTEPQPVQTAPAPAPPTGGGGGSSGGGSSSSSEKQPAFGATGSLGPGSSPDG